jgi:hypothetical protein
MSAPDDLRIAIIGTGPSGLTLAYFLERLGLKSVHLFEAQDELGGQSITRNVDGFPVEMGTVYLTNGYVRVKRIAKEVGCTANVLPPATILDEKGETIHPDPPRSSLLVRYVFAWLRWYLAGQMRDPSWPDNALSFADWLIDHGFGELEKGFAFTAGMSAQLYGPLDAVSAHSGLNWMRPSLLRTGRLEQTAHIPQGFQNMWKQLAQHLGFPIRFSQRIDTLRPTPGGRRRQVELLYDGRRIDEPFDHVFLAGPLDRLENHPMNGVEGSPLRSIEHPLSRALRERYSPFDATEVYSAAWRASGWPENAPSRCYLPAAATGVRGPLLTIRQYGNVAGRFVGQLCSYAIPDDSPPDDEERLADYPQRLAKNRDQVISDMCGILGLVDVEIVHERLWRYNIRYSRAQIEEGLPRFIEASQGAQSVWYSGGALSHWNVDAITDYNHRLAKRFARHVGLPLRTRFRLFSPDDLLRDL